MRRNVRYQPLGRTLIVTLTYGLDSKSCEAEIIDESTKGMGLRVKELDGLSNGQKVIVECKRGKFNATVVRIEPSRDGGFQIGLLLGKNRK